VIFQIPAEMIDECFDGIDSVFLIQHRVGSPAGRRSISAKSLIWSDPVHPCESVGLFLSLRLLFSRTGPAAVGAFLGDD
jgi:hypothetical protein